MPGSGVSERHTFFFPPYIDYIDAWFIPLFFFFFCAFDAETL